LYDLHGNVWEWCEDSWHDSYQGAPTDGIAWINEGDNQYRLLWGGSWLIFFFQLPFRYSIGGLN
jgi:formylglycine-generating enzyme required for sulfatase activity